MCIEFGAIATSAVRVMMHYFFMMQNLVAAQLHSRSCDAQRDMAEKKTKGYKLQLEQEKLATREANAQAA